MNNTRSRKDRTLFVSMIHRTVTDDDLYELLSKAGPIEKLIFKQNMDGTPSHALVVFRDIESVVFSMLYILPCVRSSKLIHMRPLRESSLHCTSTQSWQNYEISSTTDVTFSSSASYSSPHPATNGCAAMSYPKFPCGWVSSNNLRSQPATENQMTFSTSTCWETSNKTSLSGSPADGLLKSKSVTFTGVYSGAGDRYGDMRKFHAPHQPAMQHCHRQAFNFGRSAGNIC
ncbi:hypothetical protein Q1695_002604 [Nippostrongylus brasiliensis]|nr:hypothetical protein Q1695_002604 [Nippostrongylus brasiliensis]